MKHLRYLILALVAASLVVTCSTPRGLDAKSSQTKGQGQANKAGVPIASKGTKNAIELANFFLAHNPDMDRDYIQNFAATYIMEADREGINSDVAFCQMCLETGFLRFGNLVTPQMHNYCGLGSIDSEHPGESFATAEDGIRAHIQHLHAYGTTEDVKLKGVLIDRRYRYVNPRGKARDVYGLSGTWASDPLYGQKITKFLEELDGL